MKPDDRFPDLRDGLHALCRDFPDDYFRRVDAERAYPDLGPARLPRSF